LLIVIADYGCSLGLSIVVADYNAQHDGQMKEFIKSKVQAAQTI